MNVKLSVFLGFIIDDILFPRQSLITRLNSQRLPVTQYRLHSKVIFPPVINYYTLFSDANLGCLWLNELALKFGMAEFELKLFRLQRSSNGKTENYSIVTQQQWEMEIPFLLRQEGQSEFNGKCQIFGLAHFTGNSAT